VLGPILVLIICLTAIVLIVRWAKKDQIRRNQINFKESWRLILKEEILFYQSLSPFEQKHFEVRILEFLRITRITGIEVEIEMKDRLLVASSAIIPIFEFEDWKYHNLNEVLVYADTFNYQFETEGPGRNILGMVGFGFLNGKMAISQKALHHGFKNESDKKNTAVHEMAHLVDKLDGRIDGLPMVLIEKDYIIPWLALMDKKITEINKGKSDIRPYGGESRTEFFAVACEYFFERPKLLEKKHPVLYSYLSKMFNQKMIDRVTQVRRDRTGRNDPCPCKSGDKFKKCCGKEHFSSVDHSWH